jgi:hypothetical protein
MNDSVIFEKIKGKPCYKCGKVYLDPPHPRLRCGVDGHTAMDIVGLELCLDWLYEDCPKEDKG